MNQASKIAICCSLQVRSLCFSTVKPGQGYPQNRNGQCLKSANLELMRIGHLDGVDQANFPKFCEKIANIR